MIEKEEEKRECEGERGREEKGIEGEKKKVKEEE